MKKSFVLHKDTLDILDKLSDEHAGKLFKMIKDYQNECEIECAFPLDLVFLPFQKQFERDGLKYAQLCEKNRQIAVNRHSTKRNQPLPKVPNVTKSTDRDSDSDSDSDKEKNKAFDAFWNNYPKKTDRKRATLAFNKLNKTNAALATKDCSIRFTDTESRFIPHATTYLNGERWFDELPSGVVEEKKGYYAGVRYET